jgi:hypothetical protein
MQSTDQNIQILHAMVRGPVDWFLEFCERRNVVEQGIADVPVRPISSSRKILAFQHQS